MHTAHLKIKKDNITEIIIKNCIINITELKIENVKNTYATKINNIKEKNLVLKQALIFCARATNLYRVSSKN